MANFIYLVNVSSIFSIAESVLIARKAFIDD